MLSVNTGNSFLDSYASQINTLEADPNATPDYDSALEKQFEAVQAQVLGTNSPSGGSQDTPPPIGGAPHILVATGGGNSGSNSTPGSNLPPALGALWPFIEDASEKTGVDPNLLAAQIWQESRGDVRATSTNGGTGLTDTGVMQIDPAVFTELQAEHPDLQGKPLSDPQTNILAGAYLMADYQKQYGSADLALRAYNSGPNSVDLSDPNITTTGLGDPNYIREVESFKSDLDSGQPSPA